MNMGYNQGFKDLIAYKKSFEQGFNVYATTPVFPKEKKYSLTH